MTATVVIDDGSSQLKGTWIDESGTIQRKMIKSRSEYGAKETADGGISDHVYEVAGRDITVGDMVNDPISTTSDYYQTSDYNLALIHELLRLAGFGGQDVNLIVTLPVDTFYNPIKREQKKEHVMRKIKHANDKPLANIKSVRVAPEAVPVLDAVCLDDQGQVVDAYRDIQQVMTVDIGGTTTDITVVDYENDIRKRKSVNIGVFSIAEALKELLQNDPELSAKDPNANTLDITLRTGKFRNKTDVAHHIEKACSLISGRLLSSMNSVLSDPADVDYVIYVGGGAKLLGKHLSDFYGGNTMKYDDPEYAVSLGLLRNIIHQKSLA